MLQEIASQPAIVLLTTVLAVGLPLFAYACHVSLRRQVFPGFPKYVTSSQSPSVKGQKSKYDSLDDIMQEQYTRDKGHLYLVEHPHKDVLIIPAKYVDELMTKPEEQVNFLEDINDRFLGEYTKMLAPGGLSDETVTATIKNSLTPNLGSIMEDLQEEIDFAFEQEIGKCQDWTPLYPLTALMRIIALVSGRIFAGPELNRNEEYLSCALNFAVEGYNVIPAMRPYPKFLRPFAQYWVNACRRPLASISTMERLLAPIIADRRATGRTPHDMLTWTMQNSPPGRADDLTWQAMYQLQVATAAMHTTSNTMTHIWFDLAAHPELVPELRAEILQARAAEPTGMLGKTALARLKKLDSFLKESQRLNPFSSTGFSRKIRADTRLADGTVLPAGSTVTVPVSCIATDPAIYPDPEKFDGLRFYKLRELPGNEAKFQYVTTNKDSLNWGHGVHACPGRFFAANEIKIIMMHLILNYDIKLSDGEDRPQNLFTEGGMIPDPKGRVWLKKRT